MTEEIGSDKHRRPSSAEIDIVKLKERQLALVSDFGDVKDMLRDFISKSESRHDQLMSAFNTHKTEDAVAHAMVADLKSRTESLESDKKGPIALILAVLSGIGTAIAAFFGHGGGTQQ